MEQLQSPLVVFGPDHIDTSRAELLVQRLSDKIKEKRYKLQKMIHINEEKKKRTEMMKNEEVQLTNKLTNIEQENIVREQQLQSEQIRIKEIQFNIQMLDEHNNSIKRDSINYEQKYEQEKSTLVNKFERIKQQWTEIFKPQYEQSKVYQYLKQGDSAYNLLVQRKESLLKTQKLAFNEYLKRRQEFCNDKLLNLSIISIAKSFILRRDQLTKINRMKENLFELENKQKQLIESKNDKMKAWESVYTQPIKRDLMDICLQSNIDQTLTLSFAPIQQITWSQPMTPTPQNEQQIHSKSTVTFQSAISTLREQSNSVIASTITIEPNTNKNTSVSHLTTAIDDDDELFSASRRKLPLDQMEKMTIHEYPQSTQAFIVPKPAIDSTDDMDQTTMPSTLPEPAVEDNSMTSIPSVNEIVNKSVQSTVTFQLASPRIQPQVTSNDVQQMLLTFSPEPATNDEPQAMEDESLQTPTEQQQQQQQKPAFSMPSSIESTASTDNGYTGFNYNFNFDGNTTENANGERDFPSPINFGNWPNLGSPVTTSSNDQFSAFLQQTNSGEAGVDTSFSFGTFNYDGETDPVGSFSSFFFGNQQSDNDGKA